MEKLIRRTISFTMRQISALRIKADELEISVADLVRRIIDGWLKK